MSAERDPSEDTANLGTLAALDAKLFGLERAAVGAISIVMCVVVFLDVVHRVFSRTPGRLATLIASGAERFGAEVSVELMDKTVAPALITTFLYAVCYGAVRTRRRDPGVPVLSPTQVAVRAIVLLVGVSLVVQGFIFVKPDGIVWAPYLGLASLLWIGLIGASMATYSGRHLALEMSEKLWPVGAQPFVRTFAQGLAATFCALIVLLGCTSMADYFEAWRESPNAALVPAVDLPKWLVFSVVPYSFLVMGLRYAARALRLVPAPAAELVPGATEEAK